MVLGTDGFGRSDTRPALRRFFEVDEGHVVVGALSGLARKNRLSPEVAEAPKIRTRVRTVDSPSGVAGGCGRRHNSCCNACLAAGRCVQACGSPS